MTNPYEDKIDTKNDEFGFALCHNDVKKKFLSTIDQLFKNKSVTNELNDYIDDMFSSNCFFVSKTEVNYYNEVKALEKDQESIFNDKKFVKWFMEQKDD